MNILSQNLIVEYLCAIIIMVISRVIDFKFSKILFSVSSSKALVASSKTKILGSV